WGVLLLPPPSLVPSGALGDTFLRKRAPTDPRARARAATAMRRIAVVGAGIAGLAAARGLARSDRVTLFEASEHFGGHAHTVDFTLGGRTHAVDTAFVVYNERAHPNVAALFAELGVGTATAEMSSAARSRRRGSSGAAPAWEAS